ncbi:MAG: hypothetical protein QOF16_558 [Actinomycetota bacterium]|nr:hypothetical protein [Actinomycetota bacterium]
MMGDMQVELIIDDAIALLEKANANLQPELLTSSGGRKLLTAYARAEKLAAFGVTMLARKVNDSAEIARVTGSPEGKAKETIATGKVLASSSHLSDALKVGSISLAQATEIAKAEESSPGAAKALVPIAKKEPFHVLKDQARKAKLEAEQHKGLADRQHSARSARSYNDDRGMVNIHLELEPHIGAPIVARAEAEAERLARAAKRNSPGNTVPERFECYLADAYAALVAGAGMGRAKRAELVVLVSHEVVTRGWKDVRKGELCKIPGIGPVAPQVARTIANDAFLSGVFYDGKNLRQFKRWSRTIPVEIATALELGQPPAFDGVACVDCGNRFKTQIDHVHPRAQGGPTSNPNLRPRCWRCHQAKTKRDGYARAGPR